MSANKEERKYVVETIGATNNIGPSELRIFKNPTSDVDPNVTQEQIFEALINHCKAAREQLKPLRLNV